MECHNKLIKLVVFHFKRFWLEEENAIMLKLKMEHATHTPESFADKLYRAFNALAVGR